MVDVSVISGVAAEALNWSSSPAPVSGVLMTFMTFSEQAGSVVGDPISAFGVLQSSAWLISSAGVLIPTVIGLAVAILTILGVFLILEYRYIM